jgi:hypothetical protein
MATIHQSLPKFRTRNMKLPKTIQKHHGHNLHTMVNKHAALQSSSNTHNYAYPFKQTIPSKRHYRTPCITQHPTQSNFATHLIEQGHSIGPISDIMNIIYTTQKGKYMDTIENYHIYQQTKLQNQINDRNTVKLNAIFDFLCSHDLPPTTTP